MAYRRNQRSRGSYGRSGNRFSRSRLRTVKPTQRWQRANFYIEGNTLHDEINAAQNIVFVIAQIGGHVGDPTVPEGRVMASMVRHMDIGGIVFDWQFSNFADVDYTEEIATDNVEMRMEHQLLLCSDRLGSGNLGGAPQAVNVDWFDNTVPIIAAQSADDEGADVKFPTRVHWRTHRSLDDSTVIRWNSPEAPEPQLFRQSHSIVGTHGSKNIRLRLRLTDLDCLVFHWSTLVSSYPPEGLSAYYPRMKLVGSLYYRVSF